MQRTSLEYPKDVCTYNMSSKCLSNRSDEVAKFEKIEIFYKILLYSLASLIKKYNHILYSCEKYMQTIIIFLSFNYIDIL